MHREENLAVALRSTAIAPKTIVELARRLDRIDSVSYMFVPEGSQSGFTSFDICAAGLGVSKRLKIGSGIIRILEYDPVFLARRLLTLQQLSSNRFVLGIGTGPAGPDPKATILLMLDKLKSTREHFEKSSADIERVRMPTTFAAALRKGIATKVAESSDGLLLNFCPPEHASDVIHALGSVRKRPVISCYLKIFSRESMQWLPRC